jgi:hypothetical protein
MPFTRLAACFAAVVCCAVAQESRETVRPKVEPPFGGPGWSTKALLDVRVLRTNLVPKMGQQVNSSEWLQEVEIKEAGGGDGRFKYSVFFGHSKLKFFSPLFGGVEFDSRNPQPPSAVPAPLLLGAAYFLGYVGRTMVFTVDAQGRILTVEGEEAAAEAIGLLAESTEQTKQFKASFELNGKLYFAEEQIVRFMQPLFPQLPRPTPAVGATYRPASDYYVYLGANNVPPLVWPAKFTLTASDDATRTLTFDGVERSHSPYLFGDDRVKRAAVGQGRDRRAESQPEGKGRTQRKSAAGSGVVARADGFWDRMKLELEWLDDKPEAKEGEGPMAGDERRTDKVSYEIVRVAEFKGW